MEGNISHREIVDMLGCWVDSMKYKISGPWGKKGTLRYDIDLQELANRESIATMIITELKLRKIIKDHD